MITCFETEPKTLDNTSAYKLTAPFLSPANDMPKIREEGHYYTFVVFRVGMLAFRT